MIVSIVILISGYQHTLLAKLHKNKQRDMIIVLTHALTINATIKHTCMHALTGLWSNTYFKNQFGSYKLGVHN